MTYTFESYIKQEINAERARLRSSTKTFVWLNQSCFDETMRSSIILLFAFLALVAVYATVAEKANEKVGDVTSALRKCAKPQTCGGCYCCCSGSCRCWCLVPSATALAASVRATLDTPATNTGTGARQVTSTPTPFAASALCCRLLASQLMPSDAGPVVQDKAVMSFQYSTAE
ncbi:hypothetical protein LSAT2_018521 [Lamellibrachia satsuma]|nr:hypothetical protein LSAT2_018521 [Lamellibrachia satsuma]